MKDTRSSTRRVTWGKSTNTVRFIGGSKILQLFFVCSFTSHLSPGGSWHHVDSKVEGLSYCCQGVIVGPGVYCGVVGSLALLPERGERQRGHVHLSTVETVGIRGACDYLMISECGVEILDEYSLKTTFIFKFCKYQLRKLFFEECVTLCEKEFT